MGLPNAVEAAVLQCTFGVAPSSLMVIPEGRPVVIEERPAANIMAIEPMVNIMPFGMCMSLANPTVAAATAAALGVLTPMPCIPVPAGPWAPGAERTMINDMPALTAGSLCECAYGGVITIVDPGAVETLSG